MVMGLRHIMNGLHGKRHTHAAVSAAVLLQCYSCGAARKGKLLEWKKNKQMMKSGDVGMEKLKLTEAVQ